MIKVCTRSMNYLLYQRMKEFIPEEVHCIPFGLFDKEEDSATYLHTILQLDPADIVVNIDEDCFIYDWTAVEDLVEYVRLGHADYVGMADGGACSTRQRSPVAMNPFFNIFNVRKIREKYTGRQIDNTPFPENIQIEGYDKTIVSPFYGFFNWLYKNFNPLYLQAKDHKDGISTELEIMGEGFALHSWYSREYFNDVKQRERIDALYNEAKTIKERNEVRGLHNN